MCSWDLTAPGWRDSAQPSTVFCPWTKCHTCQHFLLGHLASHGETEEPVPKGVVTRTGPQSWDVEGEGQAVNRVCPQSNTPGFSWKH